MKKNFMKSLVLATLALLIILVVLAAILTKHKPYIIDIHINTKSQPTIGSDKAEAHIIAFEDLKCENCRRYSNEVFPEIKKEYIDSGKVRYTLINLAFIPGSLPVANAAHCLYMQNRKYFFPFVEYVYQNQPPESDDWATIPTLIQYAKAATPNANFTKFSNCLIDGKYNKFITNNMKIAAHIMGNEIATPALYINGYKVEPLTIQQVKKILKKFIDVKTK